MSDPPIPPDWDHIRRTDPGMAADLLELLEVFSTLSHDQRQTLLEVVRTLAGLHLG